MAMLAAKSVVVVPTRAPRSGTVAQSGLGVGLAGRIAGQPKRNWKSTAAAPPRCSDNPESTGNAASRRELFAVAVGASVALSNWALPLPTRARETFVRAGGIEYCDAVVGKGETTFDGDTIRVTFTAHTYDPETGKKIRTFDPFVTGGGGSSMAQGFKLTLGNVNGDIIPGLNLGIVGGDGVEPMRAGGKRIMRIPPELAFGSEGHSCYLGLKDQCTVPPNTPVEIELAFINFV